MYIGKFVGHYEESFWAEGETVQHIKNSLEEIVGDTVPWESIEFYEAKSVRVTIEFKVTVK